MTGLRISTICFRWWDEVLWTPSRHYDPLLNSVGREYDSWTKDGVLEHYWGEHIHLGYYRCVQIMPFLDNLNGVLLTCVF
jgi:hypothetical protein